MNDPVTDHSRTVRINGALAIATELLAIGDLDELRVIGDAGKGIMKDMMVDVLAEKQIQATRRGLSHPALPKGSIKEQLEAICIRTNNLLSRTTSTYIQARIGERDESMTARLYMDFAPIMKLSYDFLNLQQHFQGENADNIAILSESLRDLFILMDMAARSQYSEEWVQKMRLCLVDTIRLCTNVRTIRFDEPDPIP